MRCPTVPFVASHFESFGWPFLTVSLPSDRPSNRYYQLCFNRAGISSCFTACTCPVVYRTQSTTAWWAISTQLGSGGITAWARALRKWTGKRVMSSTASSIPNFLCLLGDACLITNTHHLPGFRGIPRPLGTLSSPPLLGHLQLQRCVDQPLKGGDIPYTIHFLQPQLCQGEFLIILLRRAEPEVSLCLQKGFPNRQWILPG